MNSNDEIIIQQIRDSFSDRICDDLCEELLQWLPIEDKIVLIFVSKQFEQCLQTVQLRQKSLDIKILVNSELVDELDVNKTDDQSKRMNNVFNLIFDCNSSNDSTTEINLKKLTAVLKIFPNITEIVLTDDDVNRDSILDSDRYLIFQLITKLCNNLQSFESSFFVFNRQLLTDFSEKFGSKLRSLVIPNVSWQNDADMNDLLQITSPLMENLSKLILNRSSGIVFQQLSKIAANNPNLLYFQYCLKTDPTHTVSDNLIKLSELKKLKYLSIDSHISNSYDNRIGESLALIGKNCKQLKYFHFNTKCNHNFNSEDLFIGFKNFSSLLSVDLVLSQMFDLNLDNFENCKQLTQFSLQINNIGTDFLRQIGSVFPNLRQLSLKVGFNGRLSDDDIEYLTQLESLETLYINDYNDDSYKLYPSADSLVTDSGIQSLINNCKHLYKMQIYLKCMITVVSIKAIVEKAIKNPGIYFYYRFRCGYSYPLPGLKNVDISFET